MAASSTTHPSTHTVFFTHTHTHIHTGPKQREASQKPRRSKRREQRKSLQSRPHKMPVGHAHHLLGLSVGNAAYQQAMAKWFVSKPHCLPTSRPPHALPVIHITYQYM